MSQELASKQIIAFRVWRDDGQEIPKEHENDIKESAVRRIREMIDQGYLSGQLCESIYNHETDQEEEYSGWWDVSEPEPECAVNSHQAMKEALELLLHEPMAERAVDKAKQALTLANGGQGNNPTQDLINQVRHLHDE